MLVVLPSNFLADIKMLKGYNFVTLLTVVRSKICIWVSGYLRHNYLRDWRPHQA